MSIRKDLLANFTANNYFHVICNSIKSRKLFLDSNDYVLFLEGYNRFLFPFINTYSYSLLSNHSHFIVRPRTPSEIYSYLINLSPEILTITQKKFIHSDHISMLNHLVKRQFHNFFIHYALQFNRKHNQSGHLFQRPFLRKRVMDDNHLTQLMIYIHANPLKHKIVEDFTSYKWSSYQAILSDIPTDLCRNDVLDWFGGKKNFIKSHREQSRFYYNHHDSIE